VTKPQSSLQVRLPQQARSLDAWRRVLDCGLDLFISEGYERFTIAEICSRAEVAPRFIYDRVDNKDALFLAVYLHGLKPITEEQEVLEDLSRWDNFSDEERLAEGIHQIGLRFMLHKEFLGRVVLISSALPTLAELGSKARKQLSDQFAQVMLPVVEKRGQGVADLIHFCFDITFANWAFRVAYGAEFSSSDLGDEEFDKHLQAVCQSYVFNN
jgi:AcrR family transcriptional regulator